MLEEPERKWHAAADWILGQFRAAGSMTFQELVTRNKHGPNHSNAVLGRGLALLQSEERIKLVDSSTALYGLAEPSTYVLSCDACSKVFHIDKHAEPVDGIRHSKDCPGRIWLRP